MNEMKRFTLCYALAALFFAPHAALSANDEELYDPAPPADSAFLRVIKAADTNQANGGMVAVGNAVFTNMGSPDITSYRVVKQGNYNVTVGERKIDSLKVEAGKYYTVGIVDSADKNLEAIVFEDAMIEKPSKAYVYFYNLTQDNKASLHAPEHNTDIVAEIEPLKSQHKEVNAITLDLATKVGKDTINTYPGVQLKRRSGLSVALIGSRGNAQSVLRDNEVIR
jgi:alginate O-acetyltransferase complex protein AlgF